MEPKTGGWIGLAISLTAGVSAAAILYTRHLSRSSDTRVERSALETAVRAANPTYHIYAARGDRTIVSYRTTTQREKRPKGRLYTTPGKTPEEVEAEWLIFSNGEMQYVDDDPLPKDAEEIPLIPPGAARVYD